MARWAGIFVWNLPCLFFPTQSEGTESLGEIGGRCSLSNTLQTQHAATHCGTLQQNAT